MLLKFLMGRVVKKKKSQILIEKNESVIEGLKQERGMELSPLRALE